VIAVTTPRCRTYTVGAPQLAGMARRPSWGSEVNVGDEKLGIFSRTTSVNTEQSVDSLYNEVRHTIAMMTSDDRMYTLVIDDMTVGNKARTNSEHRHTLSVPVCM